MKNRVNLKDFTGWASNLSTCCNEYYVKGKLCGQMAYGRYKIIPWPHKIEYTPRGYRRLILVDPMEVIDYLAQESK